jgi:hypothetical protein
MNILPGLKVKVFFPIIDGPRFLSRFFGWYFIDRVVARVRRELELDKEGSGIAESGS